MTRKEDLEKMQLLLIELYTLTNPHMNTSGMNYVREYVRNAYSHVQNEINRENLKEQ